MFDAQKFLIPLDKRRALSVSDSDWGLDEIEGLFTTLGGQIASRLKLNKRKIDARTYMGGGKVAEIAAMMAELRVDVLLVDFDLSPSQLKNIEAVLREHLKDQFKDDPKNNGGGLVLDRSGIILEIFSRHARTKEAKLQVELARMEYLMPRLSHLWSHFERQTGGGGTALKGKGMGETQIEVDRRLVKDRISQLKRKIQDVERSRDVQRKGREDMLKVALVGYTNAGKSTLLNALTKSDVLVEDALFATLDATVKVLNPKSRPLVLAIDTVGFIDRLPHGLVASFRSTLSEVLEADLLIHVLDASDKEVKRHFQVTKDVLKELGAEQIPSIVVFNKIDRAGEQLPLVKVWGASMAREEGLSAPLFVSALDVNLVNQLRQSILTYFERDMTTYEVVVPFEDGKTIAQICQVGRIEARRPVGEGTFFRFKTMEVFAKQFNFKRYRV